VLWCEKLEAPDHDPVPTPEELLGRRVAALRKAAGLTQAALAVKINADVATISRLERGDSVPSISRLDEIATSLGVELRELFRFKLRPSPKDDAIDRLVARVRRRSPSEINAVTEVVEVVLRAMKA
jgi:transcriptional regulator with XRE-family HTH domain